MAVLGAGFDGIFHAFGFCFNGGVAIFDNLVARLRAEMVDFVLVFRAVGCGRQK